MSALYVTVSLTVPDEIVKYLRGKDKNDDQISEIYIDFLNHCSSGHFDSDKMEMFEKWATEGDGEFYFS